MRFRGASLQDERLEGLDSPALESLVENAHTRDGKRSLVTLFERGRPGRVLIIDQKGVVLQNLGSEAGADGIFATSLSPDGSFIIGHRTEDDGVRILSADLVLISTLTGRRFVVQSPFGGVNPRFSPIDYLVVFTDPLTQVTHVGSLVVAP